MGMDGGGGGKLPYSYAGAGHHQDGKLVKSFSRVEPRKFGMGLVAGFLLVTCAYFSTAKFDAIHIAMGKLSSDPLGGSSARPVRPHFPLSPSPWLTLPNLSECPVCSSSQPHFHGRGWDWPAGDRRRRHLQAAIR